MAIELNSCPFCGPQQVKPQAFDREEGSSIRCMSCGGSTDHYVDIDSAAEAWNTRFATSGSQDSFVAPVQPDGSREAAMVVLGRDESGRPTVWCDPGVVDLVKALNGAGIATVWSCDGHGHRPATVGLKDGRQLLVLESLDALASISHLWPDINGNHRQPEPIGYANLHHLKDSSTDGVVLRKRSEFFTVPVYAHAPAHIRQPTPMGWSDTDFLALGVPIPLRIFRKAVMRFKVMAELGVDVESMPMHFMNSPEKYAEDVIEANRLLALIDGQRDAAPGVGNGSTCKDSLQVASCRKEKSNG